MKKDLDVRFAPDHKCVDNAIHLKAGPRLRLEEMHIMKNNELQPSQFIVTDAYHLPSKKIISVLGPKWDKSQDQNILNKQLCDCYFNILRYASKNNIKSLAFCSISTGIYGFPLEKATSLAVETITGALKVLDKIPPLITIVLYDDRTYECWLNTFIKALIK